MFSPTTIIRFYVYIIKLKMNKKINRKINEKEVENSELR